MQAAACYSNHGQNTEPTVIFEFDDSMLKDLVLEPDYDDAGIAIEASLDAINEQVDIKLAIGDELRGEELLNQLANFIEHGDGPSYLEIVQGPDGKQYLGARPFVNFEVDDSRFEADPELYDDSDIYWEDNRPYFLAQQFMCNGCTLNLDRVKQVWLNRPAMEKLNLSLKTTKQLSKQTITTLYKINKKRFDKLPLFAFSIQQLRQFCEQPETSLDDPRQTLLFPN